MNYLNFFSQQDKMISIEGSNGKKIQKSQSHMIRTLDAKELRKNFRRVSFHHHRCDFCLGVVRSLPPNK